MAHQSLRQQNPTTALDAVAAAAEVSSAAASAASAAASSTSYFKSYAQS